MASVLKKHEATYPFWHWMVENQGRKDALKFSKFFKTPTIYLFIYPEENIWPYRKHVIY